MKGLRFPYLSSKKLSNRSLTGLTLGAMLVMALTIGCAQAAATPTATARPAAPAAPAATQSPAATPTPVLPTPTPRPEKVSIIMDWFIAGYHAPALIAKEKGWFAQNGLDVEIREGRGSGEVVRLVAAKTVTFGYADATTLVRGVAEQDVPIKVIAGHLTRSPMGLAFFKDKNISKPKDLEGKSWAQVPGSAAAVQFEAFAARNSVDKSKVTVVNVDPATKETAVISGKADMADGFLDAEAYRFTKATGKPAGTILFADWGVSFMGHSFIAHNDTLKEKPDVVRRFLAALMKGVQYAKDNPKEAAELAFKSGTEQRGDIEYQLGLVNSANKLLESPNTKGKPLGWMSQLDWQETIDTLVQYGGLKKRPAQEDLYTNDFLPK